MKHISITSYDVMWDFDVAKGRLYVGNSIEEIFGYKIENNTMSFAKFLDCVVKEEKDAVEKKLVAALSSDSKSWEDSFLFKRFNGTVANATSRANIVRDVHGKAIRLIGAIKDVSQLEEAEKKLQQEIILREDVNKNLFLVAKLSFDVIWDWNLLTDEVFIGDGFEELFGYVIKNNRAHVSEWASHIYPDDVAEVQTGLNNSIMSSDAAWTSAYRYIRANGSIAKVFERASIFRNADGKAYRMIGAMQDITEKKRIEEEKELIIKELLKSNADLKQFSYITSHNLRAPLSNIQSILNIIDYSTLDTTNTELLKMLSISGKQLSRTVEDLTNILVIKNKINFSIQTIHLPEAFTNQYKTFFLALKEVGAKVTTDFKSREIDFNEIYLDSILINLFSNAIIYRSPYRNLLIHASSEKDNLGNTIFKFADNGSGIDKARHKDRLFGLYQQFHENREGRGLGLCIIKSQIEALNGKIEVESEVEKGTTFIMTFKNRIVK